MLERIKTDLRMLHLLHFSEGLTTDVYVQHTEQLWGDYYFYKKSFYFA